MINFRESHSQAFFHLLGGLHQKQYDWNSFDQTSPGPTWWPPERLLKRRLPQVPRSLRVSSPSCQLELLPYPYPLPTTVFILVTSARSVKAHSPHEVGHSDTSVNTSRTKLNDVTFHDGHCCPTWCCRKPRSSRSFSRSSQSLKGSRYSCHPSIPVEILGKERKQVSESRCEVRNGFEQGREKSQKGRSRLRPWRIRRHRGRRWYVLSPFSSQLPAPE